MVPVYAGGDEVPDSAEPKDAPSEPQQPAGDPDSSGGSSDTQGDGEAAEGAEPPEPDTSGQHS